jgi:hypothetical protein
MVAIAASIFFLKAPQRDFIVDDFTPAPRPAAKRDADGRVVASCKHLSFQRGNRVKSWAGETSENDCALGCYEWFRSNDSFDGSCLWNGKEFHQHAANEIQRNLAAATQHQSSTNEAQAHGRQIVFVLDSEPEFEGKVPTSIRHVKLGETDVLDLDFVPSVWIGDRRIVLGKEGRSQKQVIITPIRKGVTGVVLLDENSQGFRKIIYDIQ